MRLESILHASAAIGACVFILWLISIRIRDASIADIWWGPGFAVIAWVAAPNTSLEFNRYTLVIAVMTLWADTACTSDGSTCTYTGSDEGFCGGDGKWDDFICAEGW